MDDQHRAKIRKEFLRRESRYEAQANRSEVINRQKGKCYICELYAPYILELHHITPVARGGIGDQSNLVGLCPNCHRTIDVCHSCTADNPYFQDWAEQHYSKDQQEKITSIAYPKNGWK